ncbi:MAG: hypothetical protein H6578_07360 [Chitinophagales bacterium]|nr:hypothetical protein [Chitinophagales bacterium]
MANQFKLEEKFYQADLDIKDGLFDDAVTKLEEIIEEDPKFGKAYNHLGWLYETKFKNLKLADRYYQLAIKYAPDYSAGYTNYAVLLSTLGKFEELKAHLDVAIEVPGINKSTIYNEYGIMYEQLGDYSKAIENYKLSAKSTLSDDTLNRAMASIKRCETKMSL